MDQFGSMSPSQDDFGYFAPSRTTTSPSPFGSPTAQTDGGNPAFGMPSTASAGPPITPPARSGLTRKGALGLAVLALLLLGGGWFGWETYQARQPLVVPTTLGGLPVSTNPGLQALVAGSEQDLREANTSDHLEVEGYGRKREFTLLVLMRGPVKLDTEFSDFASSSGLQLGAQNKVGASTCATDASQTVAYCIRSSRTLTVEVAAIGGTAAQASSEVDEAWALQ
ncbi:MAG TPA: hypothetical protein VEV13_00725 [Candidatus Limnocylindria bacterium]|nr:hypothetical protein [Candidatus Limnocylindria bacterium]